MTDVKNIEICPDASCETCALTRKLMETMGDTSDLKNDEVASHRCVALAHAIGRTLYGHLRDSGDISSDIVTSFSAFIESVIVQTVARCVNNDNRKH